MIDYNLIEEQQRNLNHYRIIKEWQTLWNPIDELVRPLTPLGECVRDKAVELIKKGIAMEVLDE